MNLWEGLRGSLKTARPLKTLTTFKIGGPAKYFVEPKDCADLELVLELAKERKIAVLIIGAGSNILADDKGINAVVVKLSSPHFRSIEFSKNDFTAGAGCFLSRVIENCKNKSISSLETFSGIPGTIGGALAMNAGVTGKNISDLVEEVTVIDYNGKVKSLKRKDIKFAYRKSSLNKFIILSAAFNFTVKNKEEIEAAIKETLLWRKEKQELAFPSAGCIFKNPSESISAGKLIDSCGLKGKSIGGACVSHKHANFIVNTGSASAKDVSVLMRHIAAKVKKEFNVSLQPEIIIWR